jgi:hypothetical protein
MLRRVRDKLVLAALVLSFATLLTTHLAIALRLVLRARPRYRGLLALFIPPLAPVWAYGEAWKRLCWLWVGSVAAYALFLGLAQV